MRQTGEMDWTRLGLENAGFTGFVRFADLAAATLPAAPGVYLVLRADDLGPDFLETSPAGRFKERNPTVSNALLAEAWLDAASVLYIGKAGAGAKGKRGLRKRLTEYRRHGAGEKVGHWGGRYVWQLAGSAELLVAWLETGGEDPEEVEAALIDHFVLTFGARPFANRKLGAATRKVGPVGRHR